MLPGECAISGPGLTYFINLLEIPLKDGTHYTASEPSDVLFLVKTVMLALEEAAKRQD